MLLLVCARACVRGVCSATPHLRQTFVDPNDTDGSRPCVQEVRATLILDCGELTPIQQLCAWERCDLTQCSAHAQPTTCRQRLFFLLAAVGVRVGCWCGVWLPLRCFVVVVVRVRWKLRAIAGVAVCYACARARCTIGYVMALATLPTLMAGVRTCRAYVRHEIWTTMRAHPTRN